MFFLSFRFDLSLKSFIAKNMSAITSGRLMHCSLQGKHPQISLLSTFCNEHTYNEKINTTTGYYYYCVIVKRSLLGELGLAPISLCANYANNFMHYKKGIFVKFLLGIDCYLFYLKESWRGRLKDAWHLSTLDYFVCDKKFGSEFRNALAFSSFHFSNNSLMAEEFLTILLLIFSCLLPFFQA